MKKRTSVSMINNDIIAFKGPILSLGRLGVKSPATLREKREF